MNQLLDLEPFDNYSKQKWFNEVSKSLDTSDPLKFLEWSHDAHVQVAPIFFPEDLPIISGSTDPDRQQNTWSNLYPVKSLLTSEHLKQIKDVQECFDGYFFDLPSYKTVDVRLLEQLPEKKRWAFSGLKPEQPSHWESLLKQRSGNLGIELFSAQKDGHSAIDSLKAICEEKQEKFPDFSIITIPGNKLVDQGADIVQEIAIGLSHLVEYYDLLYELGLEKDRIVREVEWRTAIGQDFFHEIAKLRAIKHLAGVVQESFDLPSKSIPIHTVTSLRYKSVMEATNNQIRETSEALAAVIGGSTSVCILPFPEQQPAHIVRARLNLANILKNESFMDRVVDPGSGSYYLESLTEIIKSASWKLFQEIEKRGGFREIKKAGWIEQQLEFTRNDLTRKTQEGDTTLVGVNKFAATSIDSPIAPAGKTFRLAEPFEKPKA